MDTVYRKERHWGEEGGRCIHCGGSGWTLDFEETTLGEFEEVSHICPCKSNPSPEPTSETPETRREVSARKLFRERGHEFDPLGGSRYLLPSRTERGKKWEVNVDAETCRCPDAILGGFVCAHVIAAGMHMEAELSEKRRVVAKRPAKPRREKPNPSEFMKRVGRIRG